MRKEKPSPNTRQLQTPRRTEKTTNLGFQVWTCMATYKTDASKGDEEWGKKKITVFSNYCFQMSKKIGKETKKVANFKYLFS